MLIIFEIKSLKNICIFFNAEKFLEMMLSIDGSLFLFLLIISVEMANFLDVFTIDSSKTDSVRSLTPVKACRAVVGASLIFFHFDLISRNLILNLTYCNGNFFFSDHFLLFFENLISFN